LEPVISFVPEGPTHTFVKDPISSFFHSYKINMSYFLNEEESQPHRELFFNLKP
jgi:hypothetical protein